MADVTTPEGRAEMRRLSPLDPERSGWHEHWMHEALDAAQARIAELEDDHSRSQQVHQSAMSASSDWPMSLLL